jgi:hypothetical protein
MVETVNSFVASSPIKLNVHFTNCGLLIGNNLMSDEISSHALLEMKLNGMNRMSRAAFSMISTGRGARRRRVRSMPKPKPTEQRAVPISVREEA